MALALCFAHAGLALGCLGGISGLNSPRPLAIHDHAIQQHNAWVTRPMLTRSGFAAGYDPYFMSGYAKSLFSSPSSTLFEVAAFLTGGANPPVVYKWTVFLALASLPFWVATAGMMLRLGGGTTALGVALFLLYVWTEGGDGGFPLNYALFGMTAYLMAVPLGLAAVAASVSFLEGGGFRRWLGAALFAAFTFLDHVTSVLFLAPAFLSAAAFTSGSGRSARRLGGVLWFLPIWVLALNAFWWLPASWLRSTRVEGGAYFSHSRESVLARIGQIVTTAPPIQVVVIGLGLIGVVALARRSRIAAAAVGAFALSGFVFGYLAALAPSLDMLQPGRQTHALYTAAALLAGIGLADLGTRVRASGGRASLVAAVLAILLIGARLFGPTLAYAIPSRLGLRANSAPYLSSAAPPGFEEILSGLTAITKPGDRIFYEEAGEAQPGEPDPFAGGRYSGLLPQLLGIEVVGGFYLHVGIRENFSQIGEGKFFGEPEWTRERFRRYARMYRPTAIVCYSAKARAFCTSNPDLVEVTERAGRVLIGRVLGFEGPAIKGEAEVKAGPGRLVVSGMRPGLDGLILLRYHVVPGMRCRPASVAIEPIRVEGDPVPFIGLRPGRGTTEAVLDLGFPPGR